MISKSILGFLIIMTLAVNVNGQESLNYFLKGRDKVNQEKYQAAITDLNKAIELDSIYGDAYFYRGNAEINLNNYADAMADYTRAIEIDTTYADRGGPQHPAQRLAGTAAEREKLLGNDSLYAKAYCNRGISKNRIKNYQGAVADFNKAIALNTFFVRLYFAYYYRGVLQKLTLKMRMAHSKTIIRHWS